MVSVGSHYDVIIAGGGSAGCVLASRLSEDPHRTVLLIEAGKAYPPEGEPRIIHEAGFRSAFDERYFWPGLSHRARGAKDPDAAAPFVQARVLGGGSSINGMHAQRGLPRDYDGWRSFGVEGWNWAEVLPFFRALETDHDFTGPEHGQTGPIHIARVPRSRWSLLSTAFHDAMVAGGAGAFDDLNTTEGDGVGPVPLSINGSRRSSAASYLGADVRSRPNFAILSETSVRRLVFEGKRVSGVELDTAGNERITAGETIVACGAIHSPALLLRSGIGPAAELAAAGIDVRADRPGVGRNLSNHPMLSMSAHVAPKGRAPDTQAPPCAVVLRYSSNVEGCPSTDMIVNLWERLPSPHARDPMGRQLADFMFILNKPFSTGSVTLDPAAPFGPPVVAFNMLDDRRDLLRMIGAYRRAVALAQNPGVRERLTVALFLKPSPAMAPYLRDDRKARFIARLGGFFLGGPARLTRWLMTRSAAPAETMLSDDVVEALVRSNVNAGGHPAGSCRLGDATDDATVVDGACRVVGVDALRVVDASIFPTLMTAGTNIPVIMAAEKCAAQIRSASSAAPAEGNSDDRRR